MGCKKTDNVFECSASDVPDPMEVLPSGHDLLPPEKVLCDGTIYEPTPTFVKYNPYDKKDLFAHKVLLPLDVRKEYFYKYWEDKIPYLNFPPHWKIKFRPAFGGALIRFLVTTDELKDKYVSVYLDVEENLGAMQGEAYWEVHGTDTIRCYIQEDLLLIRLITYALEDLKEEKHE